VRLQQRGCCRAASAPLTHAVMSTAVRPEREGFAPTALIIKVGLPSTPDIPKSRNPPNLFISPIGLPAKILQRREIRTDDLGGVGAAHARQAFLDIVLNVLREIKVYSRKFIGEFGLQPVDQLLLVQTPRPFIERLERYEELRIEEAGRIAA